MSNENLFRIRHYIKMNSHGEDVYTEGTEVSDPTVLFDRNFGTTHKYGSYDMVKKVYNDMYKQFADNNLTEIAENLTLMEMPKDQDEIDKFVNIIDYAGNYYKKLIKEGVIND